MSVIKNHTKWLKPLVAIAVISMLTTNLQAQETETKQKEKTAEKTEKQAEEEKEETKEIELSGGSITMQAPASWEVVEPRFDMIEHEYAVKSEKEGGDNGRLTIMGSGGSIDQNINRWSAQFSQSDGSSSEEATDVEETEVSGVKTHMVSIAGTFALRAGGPTAPPKMKENYRMLGAIYETEEGRSYFVKFYGDKETVDANEKRFMAFVKSMKISD